MTGILWLKSPQKSGYGSLNASKVPYKWYLTILEERGKTKTPTETFDPWWKHEELSLYCSAYFPWQCSGRWVVCEKYYWTTKINIERTERFGGDCSHQDQIQRQEWGVCTRELGFSSGLEFSQESGMQSLSAHKLFVCDFWPCYKLVFRNGCPPS